MVAKAKKAVDKTVDKARDTASNATGQSSELTDALRGLGQAVATRAAGSLTDRMTSMSGKLNDYASGGGGDGGMSGVKGKAAMGALRGGLSGVVDKVKGAFGGGGGGGGNKVKLTNIVEDIDIGAPVDLVYAQWTRFTEFPRFMKKVENVDQVSDEKLGWKAQVFWSHRTWEATILEQVPNERIVWRSKGDKGHVDGAVSFHEVTPDLTKVVLVLAYHPQGLFERTGNLWRAQGRRARLELKHFRRQVMTEALLHPDEVEGWHGEIHEGQVVRGSEESDEPDESEQDEEPEESEESEQDTAEDADDTDDTDDTDEDETNDDDTDDDEPPARSGRRRASAGGGRRSKR